MFGDRIFVGYQLNIDLSVKDTRLAGRVRALLSAYAAGGLGNLEIKLGMSV